MKLVPHLPLLVLDLGQSGIFQLCSLCLCWADSKFEIWVCLYACICKINWLVPNEVGQFLCSYEKTSCLKMKENFTVMYSTKYLTLKKVLQGIKEGVLRDPSGWVWDGVVFWVIRGSHSWVCEGIVSRELF